MIFYFLTVVMCLITLSSILFLQKYILQNKAYLEYIAKIEVDLNHKNQTIEILREAKHQAETKAEIGEAKLVEFEKRLINEEKVRNDAINHARAAIFQAGSDLSNKLLEDHRKETIANSSNLNEKFEGIVRSVVTLEAKIRESNDTVDLVRNSLLSPAGAGSFAEITLENILLSSGLLSEVDFMMQYTIDANGSSQKLRPDCVVFLPNGNVLVIDSKASKFFLELEINQDNQVSIYERLKVTLNSHLKALTTKDYREAVRTHLKKLGREVNHISTIMFLPSENAIEKLQIADKEFIKKALDTDILLAGPIGLVNILSHARFHISSEKQLLNNELIIEEARKLLISISHLYEHIKKMGSAINSASMHYDKLAASFNSGLIAKAKNMQNLGVEVPAKKNLANLERYQQQQAEISYIEEESEEL